MSRQTAKLLRKRKKKEVKLLCGLCKQVYDDCPKNSYWHRWYRTDEDRRSGWFTGH